MNKMERNVKKYILLYLCMSFILLTLEDNGNGEKVKKREAFGHYDIGEDSEGNFSKLVNSNESLFAHLNWGTEEQRFSNESILQQRYYEGYGQCNSRETISYPDIENANDVKLIIESYAELFRVGCKRLFANSVMALFEKGYAKLEWDHSITFSSHMRLFTKLKLSSQDLDDLESLVEVSAFTQVYVSWFLFPVLPIDPVGNKLMDNCFIEIVSRLHALDLVMTFGRRYIFQMSYRMGVKMKSVLKVMCEEYRGVKGHGAKKEKRRSLLKQCLMVSMALTEFLFKFTNTVIKTGCAHKSFKNFYKGRIKVFEERADHYGKPPLIDDGM